MSGIQLSNELVADVRAVMEKHDPSTSDDLMFLQYLAAVSGFVLAHQEQAGLDKTEFMNELAAFTAQVVEQVSADMAPKKPAEDAFGIWKPGQS